jgi:hypothetical protein
VRADQVPQDRNAAFAGGRKAMYAVDEHGRYTIVPSTGWEVEEAVTLQAVEALRRLAEDAKARHRAGIASPLEYHMYHQRMDLDLLAQATGLWRWRIRRHFRPAVFARLPRKLLERYATALGIAVEELGRIP